MNTTNVNTTDTKIKSVVIDTTEDLLNYQTQKIKILDDFTINPSFNEVKRIYETKSEIECDRVFKDILSHYFSHKETKNKIDYIREQNLIRVV